MFNPFGAFVSSMKHLADQARRLGDAFGHLAEQVEQRSEEEKPALPLENGRRTTKVVTGR